jgi:hypothetical protein
MSPFDVAYIRGKHARTMGRVRIAPYYEEKRIVEGKSVDITAELDRCWYAGYDGKEMPEEV